VAAGCPRALTGDDVASLRYAVTDLLDDVTHAHDAHERLVSACCSATTRPVEVIPSRKRVPA
jgi:hypothetical protein